jgi:hypothetical protein
MTEVDMFTDPFQLEDGEYVVEYHDDSGLLWKYPFTAESVGGDDPYNPGSNVYLSGPWDDFGILQVPNFDTAPLQFATFVRRTPEQGEDDGSTYNTEVTLTKGGTVVALYPAGSFGSGQAAGYAIEAWYTPLKFTLFGPGENSDPFPANELTDGEYVITWKTANIDDASDVKSEGSSSFSVVDGKIVPLGRQAEGADPTVRIEGFDREIDSFYYFFPVDLEKERELAGFED